MVSHLFDCSMQGYQGWRWSVTVARAARGRSVSVSEVVLLPGEDAIVAPQWVPWSDRVRAGDLGVGVLAPTDPYDERLTSGWSGADDLAGELDPAPLHPVNWEAGLGRSQVLSPDGRRDAASRWYGGDHGPDTPMAKGAPGACSTCGWLLPIGGPLGQMFGVCSHLLSPSDGTVVSLDHGCGAHSSVREESVASKTPSPVVDDIEDIDYGHS